MELNEVKKALENLLNQEGYELSSMSFINNTLNIVVDRTEAIDLDDISFISEKINALFDELDPFTNPYVLDISSLGAEKPLSIDKLDRYINSYVNVHLINPIEGENIYEGDMVEVGENNIVLSIRIKTRTKKIDILKNNISKIRLAIKF